MPLPLIPLIWGAAGAALAGKGIQKVLEAKETFDETKEIADDIPRDLDHAPKMITGTSPSESVSKTS